MRRREEKDDNREMEGHIRRRESKNYNYSYDFTRKAKKLSHFPK